MTHLLEAILLILAIDGRPRPGDAEDGEEEEGGEEPRDGDDDDDEGPDLDVRQDARGEKARACEQNGQLVLRISDSITQPPAPVQIIFQNLVLMPASSVVSAAMATGPAVCEAA